MEYIFYLDNQRYTTKWENISGIFEASDISIKFDLNATFDEEDKIVFRKSDEMFWTTTVFMNTKKETGIFKGNIDTIVSRLSRALRGWKRYRV
jgi:hypothetical protein